MRIRKLIVGAVALGLLAVPALEAQAVDPAPSTITITSPTGSGHLYEGTIDRCTGEFTATGTTAGYNESVVGTLSETDLDFVSSYSPDVEGAPYSYEADATVANDGTFSGTYEAAHPGGPYDDEAGTITGTVVVVEGDPVTCPWTIQIVDEDLGNGHDLTGEINPCTGAFTATGVTEAGGETKHENAAGTLVGDDLDFVSEYVEGVGGNPYTYTVDAMLTGVDDEYEGTYSDTFGPGGPVDGTVVVTPGDPVNCHEAECTAMGGVPGTPGDDETCTVTTTETETNPVQTGDDENLRTTGKGKSQTRHWDETHPTTVHTTTQEYTWDGDSFEPSGAPQTTSEPGEPRIVNCSQNVTGKGSKPSPNICTTPTTS